MMKPVVDGASVLFAVIIVVFAVRKWHIIRDRHLILSTIGIALQKRNAFWIGTLAGILYIAVFVILGGKGGRVHILFGRLIFNTTAGDILAGILLACLVMIAMSLVVYSMQATRLKGAGKGSGIGLFGTFLAVLAAFCPWWMPILTALGGAAGALVLFRFWHLIPLVSAVVLILGILYTATIMKAAEGWQWKSASP